MAYAKRRVAKPRVTGRRKTAAKKFVKRKPAYRARRVAVAVRGRVLPSRRRRR